MPGEAMLPTCFDINGTMWLVALLNRSHQILRSLQAIAVDHAHS